MTHIGFMEEALATRRVSSKDFLMRSDILPDKAPKGSRLPNFKLIEQAAGADLHAHFHIVNQFQVVVSGSGLFGKKPVYPTTVHYVNAFTPYGPIIAGPDGIHYLVIRDHVDQGARYMPECRAELPDVPRRYHISEPVPPLSPVHLASLRAPSVRSLFEPQPDGLAAELIRVPPNTVWTGSDPAAGGGHFHLVISGGVLRDGREMTPFSCIHTDSNEKPLTVTTGAKGAELLMLQFARPASSA